MEKNIDNQDTVNNILTEIFTKLNKAEAYVIDALEKIQEMLKTMKI